MERIAHNLVQGSPEWDAFRLEHDGASEAAAMLGISKKVTRSELLRMKHTGIPREFSDWVQKNVLDYGHEVEKKAIPILEEILGVSFYPATYSFGRMSASCDGLTMDGDDAAEHKQWNAELAAAVARCELPDEYMPQPQQIMLVTGAKRVIFCVSDGTRENMVWMEVLPDEDWQKRIVAGWAQFHEDLKTYTPPEVIPAVVAAPQEALPAVAVRVEGSVAVRSNLDVFGDALRAYIERINKKPQTDQDFADLDASAKLLRETQTKLAAAKDNMLGQVEAVDTVRRSAEVLEELARTTAVAIEKLVKAEKENRKNAIILAASDALEEHFQSLNKRIGKPYLQAIAAQFSAKTKGLKSISSIQNACDAELGRVRFEYDQAADKIEKNLALLRDLAGDYKALFADTAQLVLKDADAVEAIIKSRIAEHKAEEERKLEAERARIRAEEEAKARAEAEAKLKAEKEEAARIALEQQEASAREAREREEAESRAAATAQPVSDYIEKTKAGIDVLAPAETVAQIGASSGDSPAAPTLATVLHSAAPAAVANAIAPPDDGRRMKLGDINARLYPLSVTADGLATLGFEHVETEKNAKLYRASDFQAICAAIVRHVQMAAIQPMRKAA